MKRVIIDRLESGDQGTFGKLLVDGITLFTGELPWRDNQSNISCIPAGVYRCTWTMSTRFKRFLYLINDVPKRFAVRTHPANLMGDSSLGFKCELNGCIALGEKIGWIDGQKAILVSAPAVRRFENLMNRQPFELEIRDGIH